MQAITYILNIIFFISLAPFVLMEFLLVVSTKNRYYRNKRFKELNERYKDNGFNGFTDKEIAFHNLILFEGLYTIVIIFFGLFTEQYLCFIFMSLFASLIGFIKKRINGDSIKIKLSFVCGLIYLFVLIFAIVNQFHLHIDILSVIKSCF